MTSIIIGSIVLYCLYRSNMPAEIIIATSILIAASGIIDKLDDVKIRLERTVTANDRK